MTDLDDLSRVLIVLAIADWIATVILVLGARDLREPALVERAFQSFVLTIGATGIAVLAGAYLLRVDLPATPNLGLLTLGLIALSVPQLVWLVLYLTGRFR